MKSLIGFLGVLVLGSWVQAGSLWLDSYNEYFYKDGWLPDTFYTLNRLGINQGVADFYLLYLQEGINNDLNYSGLGFKLNLEVWGAELEPFLESLSQDNLRAGLYLKKDLWVWE